MVQAPATNGINRRTHVGVNKETITDVSSSSFPGHYPQEDHSWSLAKFAETFSVQFHANEPLKATFSLIGLDASIANAFRRILLAEIPTIAPEYCYFTNNTSVLHDETLAHRLGLIPFTGPLAGLEWLRFYDPGPGPDRNDPTDFNTLCFTLHATCGFNPACTDKDEPDPLVKYVGAHVYARDLQFTAIGNQEDFFTDRLPFRPVNPDVLVAKLRPGQEIELQLHCVKGRGADHAKFSPVATATYRLLPAIQILRPILGADAQKFARCFPRGVVGLQVVTEADVEEWGNEYRGRVGEKKAVVRDPMRDTVSRECLRHDEFEGKVRLGRVRDHFIFEIESTGQFESDYLFLESVKVLRLKCERIKRHLNLVR